MRCWGSRRAATWGRWSARRCREGRSPELWADAKAAYKSLHKPLLLRRVTLLVADANDVLADGSFPARPFRRSSGSCRLLPGPWRPGGGWRRWAADGPVRTGHRACGGDPGDDAGG